jgi:hypothetical protein
LSRSLFTDESATIIGVLSDVSDQSQRLEREPQTCGFWPESALSGRIKCLQWPHVGATLVVVVWEACRRSTVIRGRNLQDDVEASTVWFGLVWFGGLFF